MNWGLLAIVALAFPATRARIEGELAGGNKIAAIRLMREATGMGLKDSKEAVEAMEPLRWR